ncbi:hematopoietic prostaglandin D synthase-like [Amphiura filiformis]|uniref:hematopoietic prostaglandin D synthase-like n=1 Tax=Amphiura filiformis TaxID=82378 RepID=UPI003B20C226
MPTYKLIYFNSRARGEVARLLFTLAHVEFQDIRLEYGSEEWLKMKPTTPLGQLPILEVDGQRLIQSKAIFRYLAREFGYYGKSNWECAKIDGIMDTCEQFHTPVVPILRSEGSEKAKLLQTYQEETLPQILKGLESQVSDGHKYFMGEKLTVADLIAYCDIELASIVAEIPINELLHKYPKLSAIRSNVESIDRIASWIKTRPKSFL